MRRGAPRDDEDAPVDRVGGCDFEIVPFEVEAAEEVAEVREERSWRGVVTADSLLGADAADLGVVVKGGEDVGKEVFGPEDVVVAEDGDFGGYLEGQYRSAKTSRIENSCGGFRKGRYVKVVVGKNG